MIRAVLDTNVLVSAMIARSGNEATLILAVRQNLIVPCLSLDICDEYAGVLARPKFTFAPDEITALLSMLRERGEMVSPAPLSGASPDPDDDRFIACTVTAKADYLVTGNKRHFPEDSILPAKLVGAGELLNIIALGL